VHVRRMRVMSVPVKNLMLEYLSSGTKPKTNSLQRHQHDKRGNTLGREEGSLRGAVFALVGANSVGAVRLERDDL
jgi:hypothetical protein